MLHSFKADLFRGHFQKLENDFYQIITVKMTGITITDEEESKGIVVNLPGSFNEVSKRLKLNQQISGELKPVSRELPGRLTLK
ncbi:MAG: hypothetical protein WKF89_18980 [Chitinophagaceae bacterium]